MLILTMSLRRSEHLSGLVGLRKNQAVSVFAYAISVCFVFTDVLMVVEEDHELDHP